MCLWVLFCSFQTNETIQKNHSQIPLNSDGQQFHQYQQNEQPLLTCSYVIRFVPWDSHWMKNGNLSGKYIKNNEEIIKIVFGADE
jgi:hypothetical protein